MLTKKAILITVVITGALTCTGCSTIAKIAGTGAEVNDEALTAAEFTICSAASIGSVLRKYDTPEQAAAWQALCLPKVEGLIISPEKREE